MKILSSIIFLFLLATSSNGADIESDSAFQSFLRTLPYRVNFVAIPASSTSWQWRWTFGPFRWTTCPDTSHNDSCFIMLSSPVMFDRRHYLLTWPTVADTVLMTSLTDPWGNSHELRGTDRPPAPSAVQLNASKAVVDYYGLKLQEYRQSKAELSTFNAMATAEAVLVAGAWVGTSCLLRSDNKDTRGLGYLAVAVMTIGTYSDIKEYLSYNDTRRRMKGLKKYLESWDESRTQHLIDSLSNIATQSQ